MLGKVEEGDTGKRVDFGVFDVFMDNEVKDDKIIDIKSSTVFSGSLGKKKLKRKKKKEIRGRKTLVKKFPKISRFLTEMTLFDELSGYVARFGIKPLVQKPNPAEANIHFYKNLKFSESGL